VKGGKMKRDPKPKYEPLRGYFSIFFWQKCEVCGKEFRREKGYWFEWFGKDLYLCGDCCKSKDHARAIACNYPGSVNGYMPDPPYTNVSKSRYWGFVIPPRPKAPPPPPSKKRIIKSIY